MPKKPVQLSQRQLPLQWLNNSAGLSLIEVMIVVTIVALLAVLFMMNWQTQIFKGHDARRKSDLEKIRTAFEDYYSDFECYPPVEVLSYCDKKIPELNLASVPCDPKTKEPYRYYYLEGDVCRGYRILTTLDNKDDPAILAVGCHPDTGCGPGEEANFNYGISMGALITGDSWIVTVPPENTPTDVWACSPATDGGGNPTTTCKNMDFPLLPVYMGGNGCPKEYGLDLSACLAECVYQTPTSLMDSYLCDR